mgnify:CR=1 FL=1
MARGLLLRSCHHPTSLGEPHEAPPPNQSRLGRRHRMRWHVHCISRHRCGCRIRCRPVRQHGRRIQLAGQQQPQAPACGPPGGAVPKGAECALPVFQVARTAVGAQAKLRQIPRRLAGGQPITLQGCSCLHWRDRVHFHQDYFDAGALLYEHLPVMGTAIRWLKGRLA